MKTILSIIFLLASLSAKGQIHDSNLSKANDSLRSVNQHVYTIHTGVSLGVTALGVAASVAAVFPIKGKTQITDNEFDGLGSMKSNINFIDKWSLHLTPPPNVDYYTYYALGVQAFCAALPLILFTDKKIGKDWGEILLMLLETNAMAVTVYQVSPLGPLWQNKFRPIVYYDNFTRTERSGGNNRNSFYSGHTASAAASTFFMAKVYTDYHPEIQGWDKFGIYALAAIPPLGLAYLRLIALKHFPSDILVGFTIGAICGIVVPEIHRNSAKEISFGGVR